MMTDPKLDALIARVEAATEGSAELDLDILNALGPRQWIWLDRRDETITHEQYGPGAVGNPVTSMDRLSRSLDAAMTLIPDDLWWILGKGRTRPNEPLYGVQLRNPSGPDAVAAEAEHPTSIAVAICLAALKARNA